MTEKMKLVIIDNHVLLRSGLGNLATECGEINLVAQGGLDQALDLVETHCPDVVLINLVSCDGQYSSSLIPELAKRCTATRVLLLANQVEDQHLMQALKQGAKGCLLGDSMPEEICQAMRVLINGGSYLPAKMSQKIMRGFNQPGASRQSNAAGLSPRQVLVLRQVSHGLTNLQISEQLKISKRTAEMHIYKIFKKLKVNNRTQAVQAAVRLGILDVSDWQASHEEQDEAG